MIEFARFSRSKVIQHIQSAKMEIIFVRELLQIKSLLYHSDF
jgi:hypothetical protein